MSGSPSATDLAARLLRKPFASFALELKNGNRFLVEFPWQLLVSKRDFAFAQGVVGPGLADSIVVEALSSIERIRDPETAASAVPTVDGVVRLYTDGACQGNPGPGGWGFIIKDAAGNELGRGSGGERPTTNNRMELTSVIRGLEAVAPSQSVKLVTDSQYVAKGLAEWMKGWKARGWKRKTAKGLEPVANEDLWRRLDELASTRQIVYEWVRGHAGHPENEECDRMAVEAAMNV
jgi:ribonuclease HI